LPHRGMQIAALVEQQDRSGIEQRSHVKAVAQP
jgi:hypothetical protein